MSNFLLTIADSTGCRQVRRALLDEGIDNDTCERVLQRIATAQQAR